jgi:hypothetical protein
MLQHIYKTSKRLVLAGYSLVEVSFVLMMVGVVLLPVLLNQKAQNEVYTNAIVPIETANLTSAELMDLLTTDLDKKSAFVKEITEQMVELANGAKIVDKNMSARAELFTEPYQDNTATFFEDIDPSANVKYKYILPTAPGGTLSTSQKTFFLTTADGKYVPLFTYYWEFRDQSSNTDDDKQNTSTGTYLVRGELKVFEIATPTAEDDKTTPVTQAPPWTRSLTSTFNVRNNPLVDEIKSKTPRVLLNFTFDMSRGACYSPATSQYSRRLTHGATTWTILDLISYDSGKGLLCAPYFQPSTYSPPSALDSTPWADGEVRDASSVWRPDWYDIYYNSPSQLFWTNGLPSLKQTSESLPGTAMGFATWRTGFVFHAAQEGLVSGETYSSMPSSGDYFIHYPKLNNNTPRNFPDGDFDAVALNYIRCKNYNTIDKASFGAKWQASVNLWASHFYGPNGTNPSLPYTQELCANFNSVWETPANNILGKYLGLVAPLPLALVEGKQAAFSRFWVRQNAGDFGGNEFVTVEAARMAISSLMGPIGDPTYDFYAHSDDHEMEPVWSGEDNADEEQRWISGVEFQRSAALITLFKLLQHPTLSQAYDVSLLLNDPSEDTAASGLTTYTRYPTDPIIKGTLSDPTQSNFKDVMKHLYGMNRLLGDVSSPPFGTPFTNPGNEDYRHLANKGTFDVKEAIRDFRTMVANTGTRYDHFVNVIYFPSDMSGDATRAIPAWGSKTSMGILSGPWTSSLENDLKLMIPINIMDVVAPLGDPLKGKITYVLVVHKDTYELFKDRVKWLAKEMGKKDVKVIYKEVTGIYDQNDVDKDYETFVDDTLLEKLKHDKGTVTPGSVFNKMGKEQYSY